MPEFEKCSGYIIAGWRKYFRPGGCAYFTAHSIRRLDVGATLLERVIGLQLGLIAVNRRKASIRFNGFKPVAAGKALIVDRDDPMLQRGIARAG